MAAALGHWQRHPRNVLVKLGARGCVWIRGRQRLRARALRVHVADTTGAGDAFNGGFLCGLLRGNSPEECLRIANCVGGLSTRMPGGVDALPGKDELP